MKHFAWFLVFVLIAAPAFAQDTEEAALRDIGMFGVYAIGDLALVDIQRGNEPVQQLKRFFSGAGLPLTSKQEKELSVAVDDAVKALEANVGSEDASRRVNADYMKKLNDTLTADQRTALRRYRVDQIMMRGGFQALKLIMETAQVPLMGDQEKQVQAAYVDLAKQIGQLPKDAKGNVDRDQVSKMEGQQLGKVVLLLNPDQRRALLNSRRGPINYQVKP
ncbi:MAG TPA: hypothetical protein VGK48_10515 [Terriglobia bacterium]|jgi:hypothetical protein